MSKSRSKCDVRPKFECQNRILSVKNYYIWPDFECQNRILNVKIRYSALFRMSVILFGILGSYIFLHICENIASILGK